MRRTAKAIIYDAGDNVITISLVSGNNEGLLAQKTLGAGYNYEEWLTYYTDLWVQAYNLSNLEIDDRRSEKR